MASEEHLLYLLHNQSLKLIKMKEYKTITNVNGTKKYFKLNTEILHNENGPAVEYSNGDKTWYINCKLHREDGPAIEYANGDKVWYINGKLHREDGPVVEYPDGHKIWYINDKQLTESEFNNRNKVELTLEDIAEKFNINVNQLKIKK